MTRSHVERFDREKIKGATKRLEALGSPGAAACFHLIKANAANKAIALLRFSD